MSGKHAKILTDHQLNCLLIFACNTRNPIRDKLIVLLSVKAGLRAGEIAKLPISPTLRAALMAWREVTTGTGPIIVSQRGDAMRPVSIVNWFACAYRAVGLTGCSSHSGRRTFITRAARLVHKAGGSLRDVQLLAVIGRSRPPSGTSTVTPTCSASWWR